MTRDKGMNIKESDGGELRRKTIRQSVTGNDKGEKKQKRGITK